MTRSSGPPLIPLPAPPCAREANEAIAKALKARAADTLDKVLFELSCNMKNAYSRSDA